MDLFKAYATDAKLEIEGRVVPLSKTASIKVARSGNPEYIKLLRSGLESNKLDLDAGGDDANEVAQTVIIDVMSKTILLGWEGVEYKGEPLAYSHANAKMLLTELPDFRKKVDALASSFEAFKVADTAATGNV